jgi:hypothetical protein
MSRLIGRVWVPMVIVVVVAIGDLTVSRLRGVISSCVFVRDRGSADLIIQFEPKPVICEIYGPAGRVAAGALRCWSKPAIDAGELLVTDQLAKGA